MKNIKKKMLVSALCVLPLMTSGCNFTITGNVDKDTNKSENETTNNESNTTNDVVTSDHITNDKVQEVYDMVNFKSTSNTNLNYIESGNLDSLNSKIGIILTHDKNTTKFTSEQESYVKKAYSSHGNINPEFGYVSIDEVLSKLNSVFNMNVSKNDITSLDSNSFNYGTFSNYVYDRTIDGFFAIYNQMGCSSPGECETRIETVYNYTEDNNTVIVESMIAFATYNGDKDSIYTDSNRSTILYENVSSYDFKLSEDDKEKCTKLRYTFNKRADGSYYFVDVKPLNN